MAYVRETESESQFAASDNCVLGIDAGGTAIKSVIMHAAGNVIEKFEVATPRTNRNEFCMVLSSEIDKLERYCDSLGLMRLGIGIGVPGVVKDGVIVGAIDNLPF